MMSAHGRSFFLYSNGIVSPMKAMFVHEIDIHVSGFVRWTSGWRGVYARNRLLNVPSVLVGNTDPDHRMGQHWVAIYIDANSRGEYYDPTGRPPHESAYMYVNFMNKHCLHWTYNTVRVQEEGSTVCGHHCIIYLIPYFPQGPKVRLIVCFWHRPPLNTGLECGCFFNRVSISSVFIVHCSQTGLVCFYQFRSRRQILHTGRC
jgi:hypothetical protein